MQVNSSADYFFEKQTSAIGLVLSADYQSNKTISSYSANMFYAYHHEITSDLTFLYGARIGLVSKQVQWDKITFGDMIDPRQGFVYATGDVPNPGGRQFLDIDLGFSAYSKNYYAGIAAHHINEPNTSLIVGESRLAMRYTAHAGLTIRLVKQDDNEGKIIISPNLIYRTQAGFDQLLLGSYFQIFDITIGGFYRVNSSYVGILGYHFKGFSFSYSYDYMSRNFDNAYLGGSHEVTFGFQLRNDRLKTPFPMF